MLVQSLSVLRPNDTLKNKYTFSANVNKEVYDIDSKWNNNFSVIISGI